MLAETVLGHRATMVAAVAEPVRMAEMVLMVLAEKVVMAVMGSPIRLPALPWSMPVVAVVELIPVAVRRKGLAGQVVVEMEVRMLQRACQGPMVWVAVAAVAVSVVHPVAQAAPAS